MELELAEFPVREVVLGQQTTYQNGVLTAGVRELTALAMEDRRIESVSFDVVRPGERVFVTHIHDAVEPRVKVQGPSGVFPGVLGAPLPAGQGRTNCLTGCALLTSVRIPWDGPVSQTSPRGVVLAMHDTAGRSPMNAFQNLVMLLKVPAGLAELDYHNVIMQAELRVAKRLAEVTVGGQPAKVKRYTAFDPSSRLPRVVLVQSVANIPETAGHPRSALYGYLTREPFPTWLHPNELLDGAATPGVYSSGGTIPFTWDWQHHAVAEELYQRHGKDINFAGVIYKPTGQAQVDKEQSAFRTVNLARAMGVTGAVVCWMGSGQRTMDPMLTIREFERAGIKTVLLTWEIAGLKGDEPPLVFAVPEADAIVSVGLTGAGVPDELLAQAQRVVGEREGSDDVTEMRSRLGDRDQFGVMNRMNAVF